MFMHEKIKSLQEIETILEEHRRAGLKIVQCHGVFDLLHPGHIRHFKTAKEQGDKLVVTLTPDRFVNKGPGRPAFNEILRTESLAALEDVDYVVLNDSPDATLIIQKIKPSVYVKGIEYKNHEGDITGKISEEARVVESVGGSVYYTDDVVFSSSHILNKYFAPPTKEVADFLNILKEHYSQLQVLKYIEDLSQLKVLVLGDAIIDEYQYVEPLGQSGKGIHMVAKCLDKESFLGGSLIIARHVAQFVGKVTLFSPIGNSCLYRDFIETSLDPNIEREFIFARRSSTLVKKRYVLRDGNTLTKLFETYSSNEEILDDQTSDRVVEWLERNADQYDLVLVADFGNGFTNKKIIEAISKVHPFLAVNTQTNSGNRGFNVIYHYGRADFISLNEPEARLSAHDRSSSLESIAKYMQDKMSSSAIAITQGVNGIFCYQNETCFQVPPFVSSSVDRVGAGDCFFALSSLCLANKNSLLFSSFIGAVAAAMGIQIIGNKEPIKKEPLLKFLTRLLK